MCCSKYKGVVSVCFFIEIIIAIIVVFHSSLIYNEDDIAAIKWFEQYENDTLFHSDDLQSVIDNNDNVADLLIQYHLIRFELEIFFDVDAVDFSREDDISSVNLDNCSKFVRYRIRQLACFDELLLAGDDYERQVEVYKELRLIEPYITSSYVGWLYGYYNTIAGICVSLFSVCLITILHCLHKDNKELFRDDLQ